MPTIRTTAVTALALAGAFLLFAMPTTATGGGHAGTVKVHDEATADPEIRNEPHVDCDDFWVEGFNLNAGTGHFDIFGWPPTGDKSLAMTVNWTADSGDAEEGFHFLSGPHTLPAGHYRLEVTLDDGKAPKDKMFWVDECVPPEAMECPTELAATARGDGGVNLTFSPAPGSDGTNIYRAEGTGDFEFLATVGPGETAYADNTTEPGVTYTYTVTALYGDSETQECGQVEVTTIPDLPTFAAVGAAGVLGTAAYAVARRRKQE